MLFDTDLFVWVQRGNVRAADLIDKDDDRMLSLMTYLELLQCAQNRKQVDLTRKFLLDMGFRIVPLSENIGHRAAVYMEQFGLSHGLRAADALIAATAAEENLVLCTSNAKHFRAVRDLAIKVLRPGS